VVVRVSDLDRAETFYLERAGFNLDVDHRAGDVRVVQLTPPGSACSIALMGNAPSAGSVHELHLVVSDIDNARAELVQRSIDVSEIFDFESGTQTAAPDPQRSSYGSFVSSAVPTALVGSCGKVGQDHVALPTRQR
jgi:hypothetical protein